MDTFVNSIYLYDDKVLITFNYKEGTETVTFGEATQAVKSSDMCAGGAPDFERQIERFGVLSLCRKVAAHFLHTICTFPEYWGFLRKERTDSPIRLRPKAYARLTGILNTRYPGLKDGTEQPDAPFWDFLTMLKPGLYGVTQEELDADE